MSLRRVLVREGTHVDQGIGRERHRPKNRKARADERERVRAVLMRFRAATHAAQAVPPNTKGRPQPWLFDVYPFPAEPPTPSHRTRARGSYTRSLVVAATRGHDHVPERPVDPPFVETDDGWGGHLDRALAFW